MLDDERRAGERGRVEHAEAEAAGEHVADRVGLYRDVDPVRAGADRTAPGDLRTFGEDTGCAPGDAEAVAMLDDEIRGRRGGRAPVSIADEELHRPHLLDARQSDRAQLARDEFEGERADVEATHLGRELVGAVQREAGRHASLPVR